MSIFTKSSVGRKPRKAKFNLTHERKMGIDFAKLTPILCQEVVPGDKWRGNSEVFARVAPMLAPIMHRVNVDVHYFFVPNRIIYKNWEAFITGGPEGSGTGSDVYTVTPYFDVTALVSKIDNASGFTDSGSLWDFLGLPSIPDADYAGAQDVTRVNALPFFAYQKIWDEYFRDPNLVLSLFNPPPPNLAMNINNEDVVGPMSASQLEQLLTLRTRCWEKDYFTSALPWAQRGTEVDIPLEGEGSITYSDITKIKRTDGNPWDNPETYDVIKADDAAESLIVRESGGTGHLAKIENIDEVSLDSSGVTINDLRTAVRVQEWLEKNARAGYRYVTQLFSHFGVVSSDARLQRPEYLGGGRVPLKVSEVLSTFGQSAEEVTQPGEMYGHGVSYGRTNRFKFRAEEHGWIIGIISVMPRTTYQDGIPRQFLRQDRYDYLWPEFAHLGEQEIQSKELYYDVTSLTGNNLSFGYVPRYAEYKHIPNTTHGDMRDSLDFWHMGRKFSSRPTLSPTFTEADPTTRIWAVEEDGFNKVYLQVLNKIDAIRPLPYFSVPSL